MPPAPRVEAADDDASDDGSELEWMLGFVDEPEHPTALLRHRFPSKVGGRPAWLNPRDLPTGEQLTCGVTGQTMDFLLQVYAPPPEEAGANEGAFHRTVYLFVSPEGGKLTEPGAVRAMRCQLPRANEFYGAQAQAAASPADAADGDDDEDDDGAEGGGGARAARAPRLYAELELIVEGEGDAEGDAREDEEVARLLAAYEARVAAEGPVGEEECPADVVQSVEDATGADRAHYAAWAARVAPCPGQCLRYCFSEAASPLCPSPAGIPDAASIPPCGRCGGPRVFEFQVMPQLLNYLGADEDDERALDFGTIAVYSCKASCAVHAATDAGDTTDRGAAGGGAAGEGGSTGGGSAVSAYAEEYVWVQGA
ncbi:hypothetical protein FOA52_015540 [Chlamydomonas sp. UWO 241]|nr:hypothetical protein FOA52_015540 [Chlamydomonas sp. UWO 241]